MQEAKNWYSRSKEPFANLPVQRMGGHCPLLAQLETLTGVPAVVSSCPRALLLPVPANGMHPYTILSQAQKRKISGEALDINPFPFSDLKSYRNHGCVLGLMQMSCSTSKCLPAPGSVPPTPRAFQDNFSNIPDHPAPQITPALQIPSPGLALLGQASYQWSPEGWHRLTFVFHARAIVLAAHCHPRHYNMHGEAYLVTRDLYSKHFSRKNRGPGVRHS